MIIDLNAEPAAEQFPSDLKVGLAASSGTLPQHSTPVAGPSQEEQANQKLSPYPHELTQIPTYIEHLPAKKIRGAFSSLISGLNLTMVKKPEQAEQSGPESCKIIDPGFGDIASEMFRRAA